jgi:hypothetical protein
MQTIPITGQCSTTFSGKALKWHLEDNWINPLSEE